MSISNDKVIALGEKLEGMDKHITQNCNRNGNGFTHQIIIEWEGTKESIIDDLQFINRIQVEELEKSNADRLNRSIEYAKHDLAFSKDVEQVRSADEFLLEHKEFIK